jgi:hypothetical protein
MRLPLIQKAKKPDGKGRPSDLKARQETFVIARNELRKSLVALGMSEKNVIALFGILNKAHKHVNVISFVTAVERMGYDRDKSAKLLRRLGMDDVTISDVFRMVDESKIDSEIGRVYNATVDFS